MAPVSTPTSSARVSLGTDVMQALARSQATPPRPVVVRPAPVAVTLSAEQRKMIDVATDGRDIIVDATIGSGKTTSIQTLCTELGRDRKVLYLTYSKLLKSDAQRRVRGARVQNYHGIVYPSLLQAGIRCGLSESVAAFNRSFNQLSATFPRYDLLVVDEYQDINEEYAELLRHIKSTNPLMQVVLVGDMAQKVRSDTNLDVQRFAAEFCDDAVQLPYTQSFRMGPELGDLLAQAWNKPVVGMNPDQRVRIASFTEAVALIGSKTPGDLLCLGKRNGALSNALNHVETFKPDIFNKSTVYASIRDSDSGATYGDDTAVFTTFDSSKGLERKTCVVFDFDEANWDMRNDFPGADHAVLRNVFLVAASRGKNEVVFVRNESKSKKRAAPTAGAGKLGFIPVKRFTELPETQPLRYPRPLSPSEVFDFKYAENVEACFELLEVTRLDDGLSPVIELDRNDGHIDLSPVVGHYQEAVFFKDYTPFGELPLRIKPEFDVLVDRLGVDPWSDSLLLAAIGTDQMRYANQVTTQIPDAIRDALVERLSTLLPSDCVMHLPLGVSGIAAQSRTERTGIVFEGVGDAVHEEQVFELKFVTELAHPMFLQLGLYLVMGDFESGVLWNTRTDERWLVRVPDSRRFMDAVVLCVSKQHYRAFER